MGSEDDTGKRFRLSIPASVAIMPLRRKLAIIFATIFMFSILVVASLQDFRGSEISFWLIDYNDFSFVPESSKDNKLEIEKLVEIDEDDWLEIEEKAESPDELLRFRKASILNRIIDEGVSSSQALYNNSSPQGMAFNFIAEHDKRQLHPDEDLILQRYALAVLYFATQGSEWTYGNLHFLTGVHECHWQKKVHMSLLGVAACDGKMHVTHIQLSGINLEGNVPSEIRVMKRLEKLDLGNNALKGTIPSELGELNKMNYLALNTNFLTGKIPEEIREMENAEEILLQFNELEGSVADAICDLKEKKLYNFWADCASSEPPLYCSCCTVCCNGLESCASM